MKVFAYAARALLLASALAVSVVSVSIIPSVAVAADIESEFTKAELEQMLAPIALYPDTVLSHILIAATYPLEVVQADRWAKANRDLTADAAVAAVENQDWDPSVKALVAFPQIIGRMSEDLVWTQALGEAFLVKEDEVLDSIQALRQQAYATGKLENLEHIKVQRESETIVIEPAVQQIVYIPYYDTRVVYGDWRWRDHPPVYWHHPHHHSYADTWVYWGGGIHIPHSFFFTSFHWRQNNVVVVANHHDYRPQFYSARQIVRHHDIHTWRHNPHHRRGVTYRHRDLYDDYGRRPQVSWRDRTQSTAERAALRVIPAPASNSDYRAAGSDRGTLRVIPSPSSNSASERSSSRDHLRVVQPPRNVAPPPKEHRRAVSQREHARVVRTERRAAPVQSPRSPRIERPSSGKAPTSGARRTIKTTK